MPTSHHELLQKIETLDFSGKGEAFVESKFITPLLECLGYETHDDYEVIRHGDDGSSFKLKYPPVERGAKEVKHYYPDYIPTVRKKMFWIIEAKSPGLGDPFDGSYLIQGMQYCIHPEIQAKYLLVTNGSESAVYDVHGSVFLEKNLFDPILKFASSELVKRWPEIYDLLSAEKLRTRIEEDLKAMYDKLCLSSLDKHYPSILLRQIGESSHKNSKQIEKHALKLFVEGLDKNQADWRKAMEGFTADEIFRIMDVPLRGGRTEAEFFIDKCIASDVPHLEVFKRLTGNFERQSIFQKEQTFVAACSLYMRTNDTEVKNQANDFFDRYKDAELPLLNQAECALLRLARKFSVINIYPKLRKRIADDMRSAPEIIRLVTPPTAFGWSYIAELKLHDDAFGKLSKCSDNDLRMGLDSFLKIEASIEKEYQEERKKLSSAERQIGDWAFYGLGGRHYAFHNIMINHGVEKSKNAQIPDSNNKHLPVV